MAADASARQSLMHQNPAMFLAAVRFSKDLVSIRIYLLDHHGADTMYSHRICDARRTNDIIHYRHRSDRHILSAMFNP